MTEMEITYIFTRYISVTTKRQACAFYRRYNKTFFHENIELVENLDIHSNEVYSNIPSHFFENIEDKLSYQELLFKGLNALNSVEKQLIREKFYYQKSDVEIGKALSVSSQMISKRKRTILNRLKSFF